MKKITVIMLALLIVISIIGVYMIYDELPDRIPTQVGFDGEINDYSNKSTVFVLAGLPALMLVMFYVLPKIDPKRKSYDKHKKAYAIFTITLTLFLIVIQWTFIGMSLGYNINTGLVTRALLGVLFVVMGNYMSQFRQNYFLGIRTPWTLASEYVWKKTHRLGSYCFVISGAVLFITSFINNRIVNSSILIIVLLVAFIPIIYSYLLFRKVGKDGI